MATIYQGINGPFSGRVGPVVGYIWKGRPCLRAYKRDVRYPNTPSQQSERSWFVGMVRFAATAKSALRLGLGHAASEHSMTEGNYFVMKNKAHFAMHEGRQVVNYSLLQLAQGPAADVFFHDAEFGADEVVSVDFERNALQLRASSEDKVYVYAYSEDSKEGFLSAPVPRRSKHLKFRLPEHWSGQVVHLYGFVVDRDGRPSNSTYIGVGKVNHQMEHGHYIPLSNSWLEFVDVAKYNFTNPANAAVQETEPHQPVIADESSGSVP